MRLVLVVVAGLVAISSAWAQVAAPPDPVVSTYSSLLAEANSRVATCTGQLSKLQAQISDLQKQLAEEKAKKPAPVPSETPK